MAIENKSHPLGTKGSDSAPDVSVVVPVYCSAKTLPTLFTRLQATLDATGRAYELVFVEDGSTDNSWHVLEDLQAASPCHVLAVRLMRNFGQHNALMCGFHQCRGRFVVTLDDDLQNPPEEIPKLIDAIETTGLDVVYGRYRAKRHAMGRNLGSALINTFFRRVFRTNVTVGCFRIIRHEVVHNILCYNLNFTYIDGLLAWNTQRIGEVEVDHHPRREGRSGYSLSKLLVLALNLLTNFSVLPLQAASGVGFMAATAGFAAGLYYFIQYLLANVVVPGYASTIVAVLVLGGLQLLSLGIIGEYVGRMHLNINRKPQYTIREVRRREAHEHMAPSSDCCESANRSDCVMAGEE